MVALIRKNIRFLGYGKFIVFFIGCIVFSIAGRIGEALTFEQHMVSVVSDHYYLTYFVIPILLFFYLFFIEDDGEIVLVRYKSYFSYFCKKWFVSGVIPLLMVTIQAICITVSSLGLRTENVWTVVGNSPNAELFAILSTFFNSPLLAFIAYTIFQFIGMWFLFGLCMWITHFVGKKQAVRIIICLYVLSAFWIKVSVLHFLPLTGINHFIILHHNLESMKRIAITTITALVLFIAILYTVQRFWRYRVRFSLPKKKGMTAYYNRWLISKKYVMILSIVVVGILLYKAFNAMGLSSGKEWIYHLFSGHGTGYFHILSFLELLIVNGAPLYLLALFIEKAVSGQSLFVSVRSGGRNKLTTAIMMDGMSFLLLYCMMWFIGGTLGIYLLGYGFQGKTFSCLVYMIALKFLDLSVQYMLMFVIYICTKQITAGFLVLTAANALCIVPMNFVSYLPFGLSSAARISSFYEGSGIPVFMAAAMLCLFLIMLFLWHIKFGYRKILN
ncbi:MAG: hypothetical protein K2I03_01180 [Lachnospiraceae bacterium]|nr:hypothetical protein [Lachnospiraceae bacterium]